MLATAVSRQDDAPAHGRLRAGACCSGQLLEQEIERWLLALVRAPRDAAEQTRDRVAQESGHERTQDRAGQATEKGPEQKRNDGAAAVLYVRTHKLINCDSAMSGPGSCHARVSLLCAPRSGQPVCTDRNGKGGRLLDRQDGCTPRPPLFEAVEGSLLGIEDMDHDVTEVQQRPAGELVPFGASRAHAVFLETVEDVARDGPQLSLVVSRADDEEVCPRGQLMDIENQGIGSRRLGDDIGDTERERSALIESFDRAEVIGLVLSIRAGLIARIEIVLLEAAGLVGGRGLIGDGARPFVTVRVASGLPRRSRAGRRLPGGRVGPAGIEPATLGL